MLGLEVRDCALDLAAEPAVHGQDLIETLPCYPEYLARHPARARDDIDRIGGIHVIRLPESDPENPLANTERHERIVSRRLLGNILEDFIRDLRISKRAHGHIARSLGSARGRRYGSLCGHTRLVECAFAAAGMPCCRGLVHALSTRALLELLVVCFHRLFEPKAHFTTGHRLQYTASRLAAYRQRKESQTVPAAKNPLCSYAPTEV